MSRHVRGVITDRFGDKLIIEFDPRREESPGRVALQSKADRNSQQFVELASREDWARLRDLADKVIAAFDANEQDGAGK